MHKPLLIKTINRIVKLHSAVLLFCVIHYIPAARAQTVLFDFNNAPLHTSLPISLTEGGITAHFAATGQGFSIQDNTSPVVPAGFSGRYIYPNSIYQADLLISFDKTITDFSIWYACQELACDDAATMRVTAWLKGTQVGSNTKTASQPGTWPVDSLMCSFSPGFDSVVVHYDKKPPTCQDYGVIFLADNMRVTPYTTGISADENPILHIIVPNPVSGRADISFLLPRASQVSIMISDISGRPVKKLLAGHLAAGEHHVTWNGNDLQPGVYLLNMAGENFSKVFKVLVMK